MSTFVVIGARGGVGQQLVHRLLARDASLVAKVIAVVRDPSALTTAGTGLRSGVQQAPLLPDEPRLQVVAGDVHRAVPRRALLVDHARAEAPR